MIGSIEESGLVFFGSSNLTVGSNQLSTVFSGVMQDGGIHGGIGGSLSKIGTGTLTFSSANVYTGGTMIDGGALLVITTIGSGTGSGPVHVNAGTLGGVGRISGPAIAGTGSGSGALLSPGNSGTDLGALAIDKEATFNPDATYEFQLNSRTAAADERVAKRVTIASGAQFFFADLGSGMLPAGTVSTVINNTSGSPIAGAFSNLPDGSTFTRNGNNFRASYEGGDGNNLTLTVQ